MEAIGIIVVMFEKGNRRTYHGEESGLVVAMPRIIIMIRGERTQQKMKVCWRPGKNVI